LKDYKPRYWAHLEEFDQLHERIKALEEALQEVIDDYDWVQGGPGDRDWNVLDNTIIRARALLKEADQ